MRLQPATIAPRVTRAKKKARHPILLTIAGHVYGLTATQARALADQLHDAAEAHR